MKIFDPSHRFYAIELLGQQDNADEKRQNIIKVIEQKP